MSEDHPGLAYCKRELETYRRLLVVRRSFMDRYDQGTDRVLGRKDQRVEWHS